MTQEAAIYYDAVNHQLILQDNWDLATLASLQSVISKLTWPTENTVLINGENIAKMDSAGAWLIHNICQKLIEKNSQPELLKFNEEHQKLISIVAGYLKDNPKLPTKRKIGFLEKFGRNTIAQLKELNVYLSFVGTLTLEWLRILKNPGKFRIKEVSAVIYKNGYLALPIIALLSFMIGVVITFQMGLQLQNYGANIFIVDLLGLSILREFGPLITAIMVAGRTGSAFTAQLGIMKINQEIDALNTLGVTPGELLLLPRIIGLFLALPFLTMWADVIGVFGGMVMANNMLGISWYDFIHRFPTVIPLRALLIGLGKTPIYALLIASIGCHEGVQVKENADSVGVNTTRSVVLSIFFIIVADALFSVIFSKLKL